MQIDSTRKNRFRSTGLARSAAALAVGATALGSAQAAIIYSGIQDIAVDTSTGFPGDVQGVDLDFSGDTEFRWAGGQFDPMSQSRTGQSDQHTDGFAVIGESLGGDMHGSLGRERPGVQHNMDVPKSGSLGIQREKFPLMRPHRIE